MSQEKIPFSLTQVYKNAAIEFSGVLGDPSIKLEDKLKKLQELADKIDDNNINDSKHFNDDVLEYLVRAKDPELYKAYQNTVLEVA